MKRDAVWMIQVRGKNDRRGWSATSREWFATRRDALKYIREQIIEANFDVYEYRAAKYEAVRG